MYKWKVSIQTSESDNLKTFYVNAESIQHLLITINDFGINSEDIVKIERQRK